MTGGEKTKDFHLGGKVRTLIGIILAAAAAAICAAIDGIFSEEDKGNE